MKSLTASYLFFIVLFGTPIFAFAQANLTPNSFLQNINATISPEIPGANEQVTIDIQDYSIDLNGAMIVWSINGKKITSGTGMTQFIFQTGNVGVTSDVKATITPSGSPSFTKDFIFIPSNINLIWEAQTYTPPFYEGKALFTDQSQMTVAALPTFVQNGKVVPKENLVYTWKLNGDILQTKSGYGKYFASIVGGFFGGLQVVEVDASSADGTLQGSATATINPSQTQIVVYQNHPLFGILTNNAIVNSFQMTDKESSFVAEPFYFSRNFSVAPDMTLNWSVNGAPAGAGANGNMITLRQNSTQNGTSAVFVTATHNTKTSQQAQTQFSISY
jgi:hypothetical protein